MAFSLAPTVIYRRTVETFQDRDRSQRSSRSTSRQRSKSKKSKHRDDVINLASSEEEEEDVKIIDGQEDPEDKGNNEPSRSGEGVRVAGYLEFLVFFVGSAAGFSDDQTKLKRHLGQVGPTSFDSF